MPDIDLDFCLRNDFWGKVDVGNIHGCWIWQQSCGSHQYGQTWDGRSVLLAHRVAWELTVGPIPNGMTIDHVCRVRRCVNPTHLRLLTNQDNARDNGFNRRTHCPHGHAYDETNTRRNHLGHRFCIACQEIRNATRSVA